MCMHYDRSTRRPLLAILPKSSPKKTLEKCFASLDDFRKRWNGAERKQAIIEELENEALLQKCQDEGVNGLDDPRILRLAPFNQMGAPPQLIAQFGGKGSFEKAVHDLQVALYRPAA